MALSEKARTLALPLIATLTLGLAPFAPMPHFFEKVSWLFTGHGFAPIDIFDLAMHGAPWAWLLWAVIRLFLPSAKQVPAS